MKRTMRWFAGLAVCIVLAVMPAVSFAAAERTYGSGYYVIELDGVQAGLVKAFEGGAISADVVNEQVGPDKIVKKHLGKPKYGEITLTFGASMGKPVNDWISQTLKRQPLRKNGAIISTDYKLTETQRLTFTNAVITEITFPAADGSSKEPAYITLKFQPEYVQYVPGSGSKVQYAVPKQEQKLMLPCNFRLALSGIDTTRVNKVEALTIKIPSQESSVGAARDYQAVPGVVRIPNVVLEMSEASAQSLRAWHNDFVVRGLNSQDKERSGQLQYLSPNRQDVVLTLDLKNLGIMSLQPVRREANSDQIARVRAEMYCEDINVAFASPKY